MFGLPTPLVVVLALAALLSIVYVLYRQKHPLYHDIDLQMPETLREDLLYGYYSSISGQFEQTKDHVNLFWHSHFMGVEEFISILKQFSGKVVLDLAPFLIHRLEEGGKMFVVDNAANNLRDYFKQLQAAGVLDKITYLYPSDEPNIFLASEAEHKKMLDITRAVASEFTELKNAKLGVIYARKDPFWNVGEFDVVGVDYYKQKSESLTIGEHARLLKDMKPGTKTFLVPGPAFGHVPGPWMAYANIHKDEVEAVIPFLWFDHPDHKDVKYTGLQNADQGLRNLWIEAGKSVVDRYKP